ncbi:hypothetical protein CDD81_3325 [Ophiocordyceps australis]|uniref:Alpha 1,4-glycosyltransferase domain-containing protein n=1 Tax=Ophiocordyceps australis TaxID=1399860 RepID=A0A2C5XVB6_9HYPO|nr:hypothetical protein CDD81_3325 [Ophiocordyceps australis]
MASPRPIRLLILALFALALYQGFPLVGRWADYVRQTNPLSGQSEVEQSFVATAEERACLHGASAGDEGPIPNIVHFVYLQHLPPRGSDSGDFGLVEYLAVRAAMVSMQPEAIYVHYRYTSGNSALLAEMEAQDEQGGGMMRQNPWLRRLSPHIKLERYSGPVKHWLKHAAHMADEMRLRILLELGGVYLDLDVFALRPWDELRRSRGVVLGHEGGNRGGLCNAVVAARAGSDFIKEWLATYSEADLDAEWNYHGVVVPKQLASRGGVCALAPDAFFWPTWTWRHVRYMHRVLDGEEARAWRASMERWEGGGWEGQVAYHAWGQMAAKDLQRLTVGRVRGEETRFNLLVRRFLEDDL